MEQDNPYSTLINEIRSMGEESTPPAWLEGTVRSISPMTVEIAGYPVSGNSLLVNSYLYTYDALHTGDKVLLIPSNDRQQFAVLCKVVSV